MKNLKQSISYKLLFNVLVIYFLVTITITAIHLYMGYKNQKEIIQSELNTLSITTKKSFENAIWDLNHKQLEIKVSEMIGFPIIKAIEVYDKSGKLLISKYTKDCKDCKKTPFKVTQILKRQLFDKNIDLGKVILYSSMDVLYERTIVNLSFILISVLFTSILLVILFVLAFKKFLINPLGSLVKQIDLVDVDKNIYSDLVYDYSKDDELAVLKNSVNKMFRKIDEQVIKLNENELLLQKKVEEKTKELQDYVEASSDFVWEVDKNGVYKKVSGKVENILGYKAEEIIGKTPFDFMSKEEASKISKIFNDSVKLQAPIENLQNQNIHKDGSNILLLTNGIVIFKDGEFLGYRGTDKDITKEKQKDLIILEQSKMVAMGEMIANISHQWRQPLSVISTASTGIKFQKEFGSLDDKSLIKNCNIINENAQYLSKTIDTFRNFIKEEKVLRDHAVEDEISQAVGILESILLNNHIKLKDNIDYSKRTIVKTVVNELSQVLINIINNSKDVLKEKNINNGWIEISLIKEIDKLIITIEDNGGGIPDNVMPRIFEPYFTTKHKSQGTGLGLHMSYKIVTESCGGKLYANNTKNGAKFFIEIPLS